MYFSKKQIYTTKQTGITLIELMVVVGIIGILAAIAVPSYTQYVETGKRSEAKAALEIARAVLERGYSDSNSYAGIAIDAQSETGEYTIAVVVAGDGQSYDLTASPQGWVDGNCGDLTLASTGIRGAGGNVNECWGR